MAQRRMVSIKIIDSAKFIKMPVSCQSLYFHLITRADDDGVVEAFNIMRMVGASEDDLKILVAKQFATILNDDLVTYINDWNEHNLIRSDRKINSIYQELLLQMVDGAEIKQNKERADRRKVLLIENICPMDGNGTSHGQTNVSIGKVRVGKVSSENKTFLSDSIEYRLADYLFKYMLKNNPECKQPNLDSWAKNIDLMIRVDKRNTDDIKHIIEWSQKDAFWRKNILSTSKLREKYDQLVLNSKEISNKTPTPQQYTGFNDYYEED